MRGDTEQVEFKKSKHIPATPCDAGLKSLSIPTLPSLWGEENLMGQSGKERGKIVILNIGFLKTFLFLFHTNPLLLLISKN